MNSLTYVSKISCSQNVCSIAGNKCKSLIMHWLLCDWDVSSEIYLCIMHNLTFILWHFSDKGLSVSTKLKDITEKEQLAVDVFAAVFEFFRKSLQRKLKSRHFEGFTYWVIALPVIWDLRAKQFIRMAAEKSLYTLANSFTW